MIPWWWPYINRLTPQWIKDWFGADWVTPIVPIHSEAYVKDLIEQRDIWRDRERRSALEIERLKTLLDSQEKDSE